MKDHYWLRITTQQPQTWSGAGMHLKLCCSSFPSEHSIPGHEQREHGNHPCVRQILLISLSQQDVLLHILSLCRNWGSEWDEWDKSI